jgi:hypothetical protein
MENGSGKRYRSQYSPEETILPFESLKVTISDAGGLHT